MDHHLIGTKYFSFINKCLLLVNGFLGIEQIVLSNDKCQTKGNQTTMSVIVSNYIT